MGVPPPRECASRISRRANSVEFPSRGTSQAELKAMAVAEKKSFGGISSWFDETMNSISISMTAAFGASASDCDFGVDLAIFAHLATRSGLRDECRNAVSVALSQKTLSIVVSQISSERH